MSNIYGILGIQDQDTTVDQVGQRTIYDALDAIAVAHQQEMVEATATFVQEETIEYKDVYTLGASGKMQRATTGSGTGARPGATKPVLEYEVAFPIEDFRDQVAWDDVALAYTTLKKLNKAIDGITTRHMNTLRDLILRALLNGTNETYWDQRKGNLTIRRLANSDGTIFPAVAGTTTDAEENHYITSGFAAVNISDANDPYALIVDELEEHYGKGQCAIWINKAQKAKTLAMADFVPVTALHVQPGDNVNTVIGVPQNVPGRLLGTIDDAWVIQWDFIPAGYMYGQMLDQDGPLMKRVDVPESLRGFRLIGKQTEHPLEEAFFRDRAGFGVGNRLNGVALELTTDPTYDTPAAFV